MPILKRIARQDYTAKFVLGLTTGAAEMIHQVRHLLTNVSSTWLLSMASWSSPPPFRANVDSPARCVELGICHRIASSQAANISINASKQICTVYFFFH